MSKKIFKHALLEAGLAIVYIVLVVLLLSNGNRFFGKEDNIGMPILALLLLVFSVAFMGVTIFGRSILWYLEGQKKEAIKLIFYKLSVLFVALVALFIILTIVK